MQDPRRRVTLQEEPVQILNNGWAMVRTGSESCKGL
jgi:hypothetical protein